MNRKLRKIYVGLMGRSDKAKSTRSAMLAFSIRIFSAAFIYLSHVIIARWLGPEEFGVYTYVWTWVVILGSISTLGFSMVMIKELPTYFKRGKIAEYLGLIFYSRLFSFMLAIVVASIGVLTVYLIGDFDSHLYAMPLLLAMFCIPLFAIVDVHEGICRANDWMYLGLLPNYLLRPILILFCSYIFIASGTETHAQTIVIACIIACFFTAIVQLTLVELKIRKKVGANAKPKVLLFKPWMALALPLLLTDSFMLFMANTDIVMLQYFMSPDDVGIYYAAVKTTLLVAFIYFAVVVASSNKFAEHWHDDDRDKLTKAINHSVVMTFVPSFLASLGIIAVGYWFLAAYGPEFTRGYPVIVILSLGAMVRAATGPTEWMMTMMGQQKTVVWVIGCASVVNISLNIFLIPLMGLEGAATATAVSMAGTALFLFMRVRRVLKIPIKFAGFF